MSLLAVSIGLAVSVSGADSVQLSATEVQAWKRIEPAVLYLLDSRGPGGSAALIDGRGYYIAHRSAVSKRRVQGRLPDGQMLNLEWRASDDATQLVLLVALDYPERSVVPVKLSSKDEPRGERLFAVLPSGPIRAEFYSADKLGVLSSNRRVMSLREIRFEAPLSEVGGALVFTQSGELLGALNATLQTQDMAQRMMESVIGQGGGGIAPGTAARAKNQMGPAEMTVAYTVGPDALRRVVEGFRSPTHEVSHPAIGVLCRDANGAGALVDTVQEGSPAAIAGIRKGDVIVEMAGSSISNQLEFARIMLRRSVGERMAVKLRRGGAIVIATVIVGK